MKDREQAAVMAMMCLLMASMAVLYFFAEVL